MSLHYVLGTNVPDIIPKIYLSNLVKPTLEAYPDLVFAKGPHGFTLLHHAEIGEAQELYDYLIEKGLKETHIAIK